MSYTYEHATLTFKVRRAAAARYMKARGIGESAVDLIPDSIRRPCGPIKTNEGMYWTHTPGKLTLCAVMVRMAFNQRGT